MAIGVFGLKQVYSKQLENVEERNLSYWPEGAVYGYFGGGYYSSITRTNIERFDFSNETVSSPGKNLLTAKYQHYGLYSSLYGFYCGGVINPGASNRSEVNRIDFSNESVSAPGKNITARHNGGSISSRYYGYIAGGQSVSSTQRLDFSNETIQTGNNMTYNNNLGKALMDNFNYGYVIGGSSTSYLDRLDYSSETYTRRNSLPRNVETSGTVSSSGYGYSLGGYASGDGYISSVIRLEFSSETSSLPGQNLSYSRGYFGEVYDTNAGYVSGGTGPETNIISRIDFSTEVVSTPGNNLSGSPQGHTAVQGGASILPS